VSAAFPHPRLRITVRAVPENIPVLRHAVANFARAQGVDEERGFDVALAVSESVTNAILHAYVGREAGTVIVEADPAQDEFVVRVSDDGCGMQPNPDSPGLGLGLPTIGRLCSSFEIEPGSRGIGTAVRMVFSAPGVRGPRRHVVQMGEDADLLGEVGRLADRRGWPSAGVLPLVELLVPALADACTIDLVGSDGELLRVATRVDRAVGSDADVPACSERGSDAGDGPTLRALHGGDVEVVMLGDELLATILGPAAVAARTGGSGLEWWASAPMVSGARRLGVIGFGFTAARGGADELVPSLRLVAERIAGGLANDSLMAELERTTTRLERVLSALSEAVTVNDNDGRVVYANAAAAELLGVASPDELTAAAPGSIADRYRVTLEDGSPIPPELLPGRQVLAGEPSEPVLLRSIELATGRERWCTVRARLLDDEEHLAVNVFRDVTDSVIADRRLRFLAEAGRVLGSSLELGATLEQVARLAVPALADWCAVDLWDGDGTLERAALAHIDPEKVVLGRELQDRHPLDLDAGHGIAQVLRDGVPQLHREVTDAMLREAARDEQELRVLRELGMRSVILAPLTARGRVIGALTLVAAEMGRAFDASDLDFAHDAATRFAQAVDNARLFEDRRTVDA